MDEEENAFFDLLQLPTTVGNIILVFLSSGSSGLCNVLNFRLVCKTTKSWVENLPRKVASKVFSKACVKVKFENINEDYITRLTSYPPPKGISAVYISMFGVKVVPEKLKQFEQVLDFWCPRLEVLDFAKAGSRLGKEGYATFAHMFNMFLRKCEFLQQFNFSIYCLMDFVSLSPFITSIKETDAIKIQLHFGSKIEIGSLGNIVTPDFFQRLCDMIRSIIKMSSKYRVTLSEEHDVYSVMYDLKKLMSNEVSVYKNFLKLVDHLNIISMTQVTQNLHQDFPYLKCIKIAKDVHSDILNLNYPSGLTQLEMKQGFPRKRLPLTLTIIRLENLSCSGANFIDAMGDLQAECPNLKELQAKWLFNHYGNQMIERRQGESRGFPNLRNLRLVCSFREQRYPDPNLTLKAVRSAIDTAFPWKQMKLKSLHAVFAFEGLLDYARVISKETLSKIAYGASQECLLRVQVLDECVTMESLEELACLKALASSNCKKRENKYGRKILWHHPEFLLDDPNEDKKT